MGIYSHFTDPQLTELRDKLVASLTARLTAPTSASTNGRSVSFQQRTDEIRREIEAVNAEVATRQGLSVRRPIYLV